MKIWFMSAYIPRLLKNNIQQALQRSKSILLLGARQTGKTTLVQHQIHPDMMYSFAKASDRQRYEQNLVLLEGFVD